MTINHSWLAPASRRRFLQLSGGGLAIAAMSLALDPAAEAAGPIKVEMKVVTGKMIGRPGWPQFEPGDLTLPSGRLVEVTVRCYDDGNAQIPGGYNKVSGTVGNTMRLIKGTPKTIAANAGTVLHEIPVKDVAHTFTVNGEHFFMNVPMPVSSTVIYQFKTPKAGKYAWQCMAACGTGAGGWAGPMMTDSWMQGFLTIT
ncbi:MAG: hypothetical protein KGK10_04880 [Rhodospirillales bacterium]|jgi:plastocyanin|nr:hypothetical protein [Rhodospirillales bacterium]